MGWWFRSRPEPHQRRPVYSFEARKTALDAAVALFARASAVDAAPTAETVLAYATAFLGWVSGARLLVHADALTYQQGNPSISQATRYVGGKVQLADSQQVTISVDPVDSKGFDVTGDTITYTSADPTIIAVQPASDGLSVLCVAGNPGSTTVTISDGTITGTEAFDVTTGPVASFKITEGTPVDQPPAPPAP